MTTACLPGHSRGAQGFTTKPQATAWRRYWIDRERETCQGVIDDHPATGNDVSWYSVTRHSLEDVEVTRLVMRRCGNRSRRLSIPHNQVGVRAGRNTTLQLINHHQSVTTDGIIKARLQCWIKSLIFVIFQFRSTSCWSFIPIQISFIA